MSEYSTFVHSGPSNVQELFPGSLLGPRDSRPAVNHKQRHKVEARRNVVVSKAHHGLHGFSGDELPMSSDQNPELSPESPGAKVHGIIAPP